MVANRQSRVVISLPALRSFVKRLRQSLGLAGEDFSVGIVDDHEIELLNAAHRGVSRPTDVLSFPWEESETGRLAAEFRVSNFEFWTPTEEFAGFLGDVVISAETARRNAQTEGHSTQNEICWLILHGLLHLVGYDHEKDDGEMTAVELSLRARLGVDGKPKQVKRQKVKN